MHKTLDLNNSDKDILYNISHIFLHTFYHSTTFFDIQYAGKFDLRQYYLITMDNEYVRFWSHWLCTCKLASEEFSFDDFNEQKHITNTTVQRRYKRENTENLPYHHMWSIHTLIDHFEKVGRPDVYDKKIYPTIKQVLRMISKVVVQNVELKVGR